MLDLGVGYNKLLVRLPRAIAVGFATVSDYACFDRILQQFSVKQRSLPQVGRDGCLSWLW